MTATSVSLLIYLGIGLTLTTVFFVVARHYLDDPEIRKASQGVPARLLFLAGVLGWLFVVVGYLKNRISR